MYPIDVLGAGNATEYAMANRMVFITSSSPCEVIQGITNALIANAGGGSDA